MDFVGVTTEIMFDFRAYVEKTGIELVLAEEVA